MMERVGEINNIKDVEDFIEFLMLFGMRCGK